MERERLTRLLENPSLSTRNDADELRIMAERFPWFSGAQLLRAASERAQGNVLADEALKTAAAHLPSRAVLRDAIEHSAAPSQLRVVRTRAPEPPAIAPTKEKTDTPAPAPPALLPTIPNVTEAAPEPAPIEAALPNSLLPMGPESRVPIEEPLPGPIEMDEEPPVQNTRIAETPVPAIEEDELDRQVTRAALASAFDLTLVEPLPVSVAPPEIVAPTAPTQPLATANSRLRFSDWLENATDDGSPTSGARFAAPTAAVSRNTGEPFRPEATITPAAQTAAQPTARAAPVPAAASELIDRFIRQQPPEIPPKPAFFTPQQAAKKSLDDTAGLVTETLATIYARQGNIPKAMEAYRRLALKYPDKSAYFAALSKALEEQQTP